MTTYPPETLEFHRLQLETDFKEIDIDYDFDFLYEPDGHGYCYSVNTPFGTGMFSDNNPDKELKMFILKNSSINYAKNEDLTSEQFETLQSCVEIPTLQDFSFILTHRVQPDIL